MDAGILRCAHLMPPVLRAKRIVVNAARLDRHDAVIPVEPAGVAERENHEPGLREAAVDGADALAKVLILHRGGHPRDGSVATG